MAQPSILRDFNQTVSFGMSDQYVLPSCHIHNHNELLLIGSGRLLYENNLQTVEVTAPAAVIHNSYTLHRVELLEGKYERVVVQFEDSVMNAIPALTETIRFFKNANMTVIRLTDEMSAILKNYVDRFSAMSKENGSWNALTCLILYEIAQFRSEENTVGLTATIPYVNDVMNHIAKHYGETLKLDELAARFFVSRAKLTADFAAATGMTIKQYTTLVRMNVARGMIVSGESISDTARACGYSSVSNFSATFAKYFGGSPLQYRNVLSAQEKA